MRAVIDRRICDTATASPIASWHQGEGRNDFHWTAETLYRTGSGRLFLHGKGNGLSKWATRYKQSSGPGESIVVMTTEQALDWLEERRLYGALEEHFPDHLEAG